ncbi:tail fiber domain-containing protein [Zobellia amurskyensis]|uniref:Tail fiber domain-containing protein n=3 Tax=Zobellia TaxID=112040 RepID=A0A7X3D2M9_9FLAO|nr:tail fiber domain-containing protein [Zobellia amurskyensis]MUH37276.1 tail fiber domain-containing protein [Zobellia amurskyensis]
MKKNYASILIILAVMFCGTCMVQAQQKNYINYQGVARNSDNELMEQETIDIGIALKFGSADAATQYEETHAITTDANGVFNLQIGSGNSNSGSYSNLPWGQATFVVVSFNGAEVGTTELMAVPYAMASGSQQWETNGNDIENKNVGEVKIKSDLRILGGLNLSSGNQVNEISDDGELVENSNGILPTQRAVKTYVDNRLFSGGGGGDAQIASEVPYNNAGSGLTAGNVQDALDELVSTSGGGDDADADPTNEIQDISLSGTDLSITDGSTIDLSAIIPPGGTDDQNASEVPFDNTGTGLAAVDTQAAIEELAAGGLVDTDDQNLSLSGTMLQIEDGTGVDLSTIIPPGGTDDQNASEVPFDNTGTGLAAADTQAAIEELAAGGLVDTDDQGLIMTGDVLSIEDGTGSVDLNDYVDVTGESGLLLGDGTNISGLEGTADGQVAKWDAGTSKWVAGTDEVGGGSALWTDNAGDIYFNIGKVGVGTDSPDTNFEVSGIGTLRNRMTSTDAGSVSLQWMRTGAANTDWAFTAGEGRMELMYSSTDLTGGTVHTRLLDDGTLDVVKGIRSGDLAGTGERNVMADADGNFIIGTGSGGSSLWEEDEDNIYRSSGNVGVGVSNPEKKMHVGGNLFVQTNLGGLIFGFPNNGNQWRYSTRSQGADLQLETKLEGSSSFLTRFRMFQGGEFQFGPSSNISSWVHVLNNSTITKPLLKLEEDGDDFSRLEFKNTESDAFWHIAGIAKDGANGGQNSRLNFYFRNDQGASNRMAITGDGDVFVNGSLVHNSDARLKKNIKNLDYGLDEVLRLQPKSYLWLDDRSSGKRCLGLIAQEVQQIIPEIIYEEVDAENTLSLSYTQLIPVVVTAIQEQQLIIEQQSGKIANLEERLQRLEAIITK